MALTPPFATVGDLQSRWRPLLPDEASRSDALLLDASQLILDEDTRGVLSALTDATPTLVRVTCAVVRRAMASGVSGPAITNEQQTTGPFSHGVTYANPTGDLYLTTAEKRALGFLRQRAGGVDMWTPVA